MQCIAWTSIALAPRDGRDKAKTKTSISYKRFLEERLWGLWGQMHTQTERNPIVTGEALGSVVVTWISLFKQLLHFGWPFGFIDIDWFREILRIVQFQWLSRFICSCGFVKIQFVGLGSFSLVHFASFWFISGSFWFILGSFWGGAQNHKKLWKTIEKQFFNTFWWFLMVFPGSFLVHSGSF